MDKAPDAFRTISEVADDLDIPQHVLRFWESRFVQIKPMKRGGGRRYYRPDDVALLRGIRHLLYGQGYTIRGVQGILRERGVRFVQEVWEEGAEQPLSSVGHTRIAGVEDIETSPPGPHGERREPTFSTPTSAHAAAAAPLSAPSLTPAARQALRAALAELAQCRQVLVAALDEAG